MKITHKWLRLLHLRHFDVYYLFADHKDDSDNSDKSIAASIETNNKYITLKLVVHLDVINSVPEEDWEAIIIHELCHVLMSPTVDIIENIIGDLKEDGEKKILSSWLEETDEFAVERLSRIILSIYRR